MRYDKSTKGTQGRGHQVDAEQGRDEMGTEVAYEGNGADVLATCKHCGGDYWKVSWQRAAHCTKRKGIVLATGIYRDAE